MNYFNNSWASTLSEGASYVQAKAKEAAAYARPDEDDEDEEDGGAGEDEQDAGSAPRKQAKKEAQARVDPIKQAM